MSKNNAGAGCNAVSRAKACVDFEHIPGWPVNAERPVGIGFRVFDYAGYGQGTVNKNHVKRQGRIAHGKSLFLFLFEEEQHAPGGAEFFAIHQPH